MVYERTLSDGGGFDGFFRFPSRSTVQVFLDTPATEICTGAHRAHLHEVSVAAAAAQESSEALSVLAGGSVARDPDVQTGAVSGLAVKSSPTAPPVRVGLSRTPAFLILDTPTPLCPPPDLPRGPGRHCRAPIAAFLPGPVALVRQGCAPLDALFPNTSFGTGRAAYSSNSRASRRSTAAGSRLRHARALTNLPFLCIDRQIIKHDVPVVFCLTCDRFLRDRRAHDRCSRQALQVLLRVHARCGLL